MYSLAKQCKITRAVIVEGKKIRITNIYNLQTRDWRGVRVIIRHSKE